MKERVVIWEVTPGSNQFKWFCSVIPQDITWQQHLVNEIKSRGYNLAYAGVITPELDNKYPEYPF